MLDENEHSRKEDGRSLHRLLHKAEQQDATVVVDSAAFFSELPPEQAPPPRRPQQNTRRNTAGGENGAYQPPKRGKILLIVQAILSVLALVQLWRTQMLPVLYLVVLAALLVLLWLLVKRCQEYKTAGTVSRVFSVVLCAAMAVGCVWAQQGLDALGNMTNGFLSNAEANKITKEPFVLYLSGVDTPRKIGPMLKMADVVVYDRLADERILRYAPAEAEYIYVGKASSQHTMKQGDINQLLVDKAKATVTTAFPLSAEQRQRIEA